MALLDMNRNRGQEAGVSQWVFEDAVGRISARDTYGNLIMALAAGPLFGERLAAAFSAPSAQAAAPVGGGFARTAFPR
jgi:hypothetical protein